MNLPGRDSTIHRALRLALLALAASALLVATLTPLPRIRVSRTCQVPAGHAGGVRSAEGSRRRALRVIYGEDDLAVAFECAPVDDWGAAATRSPHGWTVAVRIPLPI